MDIRSEIEKHERDIRTLTEKQLIEIRQLHAQIAILEDKTTTLQDEIGDIEEQYAPQLQELAEKKEIIAQWKAALLEHENKLVANQQLIALGKTINSSQTELDRKLEALENEEIGITKSIREFHLTHNFDANAGPKLNQELQALQAKHLEITQKITRLRTARNSLNYFIRKFLEILEKWEWRTNPAAIEHEKLKEISKEIQKISRLIAENTQNNDQLNSLRQNATRLDSEMQKTIDDKTTLERIRATEASIRESVTTIKQLTQQIQDAETECKKREDQIKQFERKIQDRANLIQEKDAMTLSAQEKALELTQLDNPARTALKISLKDKLLQIATHREHYIQDQAIYRQAKHSVQLFKPQNDKNTLDVPNSNALNALQEAIKQFQAGLDRSSQEYKLLSQIATKLVLWQMAESTSQVSLPLEARKNAHQALNKEISTLIEKLPIDNPLRAASSYLNELTWPLEAAEKNTSQTTPHPRKR